MHALPFTRHGDVRLQAITSVKREKEASCYMTRRVLKSSPSMIERCTAMVMRCRVPRLVDTQHPFAMDSPKPHIFPDTQWWALTVKSITHSALAARCVFTHA